MSQIATPVSYTHLFSKIWYSSCQKQFLLFQDWWDRQIERRGYPFCLSYLPKILLAVGITLLDEAYYKVACWLNDKGK